MALQVRLYTHARCEQILNRFLRALRAGAVNLADTKASCPLLNSLPRCLAVPAAPIASEDDRWTRFDTLAALVRERREADTSPALVRNAQDLLLCSEESGRVKTQIMDAERRIRESL